MPAVVCKREARSSAVVRFQLSNASAAARIAGSTCSRSALWNTPMTSEGRAGLMLLILSCVLIRRFPITMSYSRPSSARTLLSAARMPRAFSALLKSVSGSFLKGVVGIRSVGREVSSTVAIIISFVCSGLSERCNRTLYFTLLLCNSPITASKNPYLHQGEKRAPHIGRGGLRRNPLVYTAMEFSSPIKSLLRKELLGNGKFVEFR